MHSPLNIIFVCLIGLLTVPAGFCWAEGQAEPQVIYLNDMSHCEPQSAIKSADSAGNGEANQWRLIPYRTKEVTGTMLGAASYVNAPEVRLPIDVDGWYSVYLGIWNPHLTYDGKTVVKARLSNREVFQQFHPGASPDNQGATFIEEVHFGNADLSEESYIAFGKSNGMQPRSSFVAYVKLVPLTTKQVEKEIARRNDPQQKNLVATFDGSSIYHFSDCTEQSHLLEWVEKHKDASTKKILWAVTYGDKVGFPTSNPNLTYLGDEKLMSNSSLIPGNDYQRGHLQMEQFFRKSEEEGIVPQQKLAEHTHSLGMQFDLMFRIGFLGGLGLSELHKDNFVSKHPEVRQVTHDGRVLEKGSLAFPLMQQLILEQIEESCQLIDTDGINLCFVRGPHFLLWEEPVRKAFEEKYGESSDGIAENDPRIKQVRADIMTGFMQQVRNRLDELGEERGRPFTLSVWVWPHDRNVWLGRHPLDEGLDVQEWIKQDLLDSVLCQEGIDQNYIDLGKEHGCEFTLFTGYRDEKTMSPTSVLKAEAEGVGSFVYWDVDAVQNDPRTWRWLRMLGVSDRLKEFRDDNTLMKRNLFQLIELNGIRVDAGLADAVYSGG
ncbi:hypothetical protein Pla110_10080 [Polystyrenella longa]|uniref:Glycosyl hydrolase-like 10 domain-containing protein n=1 Tax=Polystyrenella longa TaxID=2528007 RepID=A0A518CJB3_9PLAN|nr:hypothetical protein [Polystyrenella longa]QDU79300.1 hypothetical protein Pla110_10080 [Polystyrenella longa]